MSPSDAAQRGTLRPARPGRHPHGVNDEERGIYRGEVIALMGAIADIRVDVRRILWYIEGEDDDEWEEEEEEDPSGDT